MLFLYAMELLTDEKELAQFEQIMNKYRRMMYNSAYGFLLDPTVAEDAVTDALMGVLRNFDAVKGLDNRELQNYLCKAARNAAISINRKRERLARHEVPLEEWCDEPDASEDPFVACIKNEKKRLIAETFLRMNGDRAKLIRLKFEQGMSETEISKVMNCSQSAVHRKIEKARQEFISIYTELEGTEHER